MRYSGHLSAAVALARTQVGYVEQGNNRTKYGKWFGWDGVAWCAIFLSWVFAHTGQKLPPLSNSNGAAYVATMKTHAQRTGQWRDRNYNPKPGDLIVFWFTSRPDHIEVVAERGRMRDGRVHTIGGNTSGTDGVRMGGRVVESYRRSGIHGFIAMDSLNAAPKPPPFVPTPPPEEDEEMSAVVIRLKTKNHKHFGRVEAVTAMHRRWIPGPELELHQDLGGKVLQVDVPSWNKWVSNKEPVGTNRMNGPLK